jgi:hypothetical protein
MPFAQKASRLFAGFLLLAGQCLADPALWLVKGPHAAVYLFGTVHVLKKDEPWRTPKIDAAIERSGSLWLEIPDADNVAGLQPLIVKLGLDTARPLSSKLTPEQLNKLNEVAHDAGIPGGALALEPMKPWLAAVTVSVAPMMKAGFDPSSGVEKVLKPEFLKANKPVKGFETAEQQVHYFADMTEKAQVEYLASELDGYDGAVDKFSKLVAAWYAGKEADLDEMFSGEFRAKYPELFQTLVVKRNQGFVSQIDKLLKGDGTVFVAVGAGHLVGRDGVPAMLEKKGYQVVRQ